MLIIPKEIVLLAEALFLSCDFVFCKTSLQSFGRARRSVPLQTLTSPLQMFGAFVWRGKFHLAREYLVLSAVTAGLLRSLISSAQGMRAEHHRRAVSGLGNSFSDPVGGIDEKDEHDGDVVFEEQVHADVDAVVQGEDGDAR